MNELELLISSWEGEAVVSRFDRPTGTWIFIALHSSRLGRPSGGTRLHIYPTPADGLHDAMRLAAGMTAKWAALDIPIGGAKAVLAAERPLEGEERRGLLLRYGALVEALSGAFATGEDLGVTPEDMAVIAEATSWVHGTRGDGGIVDPGPFTGRGVFFGIEAAVRETLGRGDLTGVRVLVQGAGDVGGPLCRDLADAGTELLVADPDTDRTATMKRELGATIIDPEAAYDTDCDVFAPCAVGAVINRETIPRLRCRVVAGSANNQLGEAEDAGRLHEAGIAYAPDYVINGGGALAFATYTDGEKDLDKLMGMMSQVGTRVGELLREAKTRDESAAVTAQRQVDERLALGA